MKAFTYERAIDIDHAVAAAQKPGARFIAGGTNLLDLMKGGIARPNRLVDVSSRFASVISSDATQLWRGVVANETPASQYSGLFGDLAAWVGEECTIDAGTLAWRRVERLQREGVLSDSRYHDAAFVTRGSFVPALRSFLLSHGYCHGVLD